MRKALSESCEISLTGYRALSFLEQHADGVSLSELADALGLSAGTVCLAVQNLERLSLVKPRKKGTDNTLTIMISGHGQEMACSCDEVLADACRIFLSPLSTASQASLLSGSLITSSFLGITRFDGGTYFAQYAALVSFLMNEQNFTQIAKMHGLCLGEYRVLLALYEHPSTQTATNLQQHLIAHKSEISNWCTSLDRKGLISRSPNQCDKRSRVLILTSSGQMTVERINTQIDNTTVRPIENGEISLYTKMFQQIMDASRNGRKIQ